MSGIAIAVITGNVTRDPELNDSGKVLSFSVAVNQYDAQAEDKQSVHYFDVRVLGNRAQPLSGILSKGKGVTVSGQLVNERWEKDGQKRSVVRILVGMGGDVVLQGGGDRAEGESSSGRSQVSQRSNGGDKQIPF